MNRILWPVGILLLVGTLLGSGWALNHGNPNPDSKNAATNEPLREVFCLGWVDVEDGVSHLHPTQPGQVVELAATRTKDGKERVFKKGEVLLKLKSEAASFQLGKAKAALRAAEAELEKAKLLDKEQKLKAEMQEALIKAYGHEKAKTEADLADKRKKIQDAVGNVSKELVKAIEETVAEIDAKITAEKKRLEQLKLFPADLEVRRASADVDAKRDDVKLADELLKEHELVAPFEGTVLRFNARVGELLGASSRAPAVEFCPNAPRIVRAEVIQEWEHRVHVGQEAEIDDDSYSGPSWPGRVKSLSPWMAQKPLRVLEPFMQNDVRTREAIIEFTGGQSPVTIGQRVRVKIKI
jgi:multidrug resistance efflux pump